MTDIDLIEAAKAAMEKAYAPYSKCKVGAALLTKSGKLFTGCNIENASFSPTVCAERVAFFTAVSNGEKEFEAIAVVGGKNGIISDAFPPCGVCRQVMSEFCDKNFRVIFGKKCSYEVHTLGDILPYSFEKSELNEKPDNYEE